MIPMIEIIPVMDVMNGVVVHAVAGKRDEYKPLEQSVVAGSPRPEDVLAGFRRLGCRHVYIADLDAILERGDNAQVIDVALSHGFKVLADIGRMGLRKSDSENLLFVLGTEYIVYPDELGTLSERVVSLDIMGGRVVFRNTEMGIAQAARDVCSKRVRMVIVLNLDLVGTLGGVDINALNVVKDVCYGIDMAVGGGLKSVEELRLLKELGVRYVLTATAIHKGVISSCRY